MPTTILITGASGFLGSAAARYFLARGQRLVCPSRQPLTWQAAGMDNPIMPELAADNDWSPSLDGVAAVIHCAARVHVMQETASDPLAQFRAVNVAATLSLARQAAAAGVRHFIFISSVKVNGEVTAAGSAFRETDTPQASDPYGVSKCEAETALLALAASSSMAITIIRPPLIYGPGVKANFLSMLRWLKRGLPLPLASTNNRRSFVYIENLLSLIDTCLFHPRARGEVFLVSDGGDVSTADLLRACGHSLRRPARLWPCPPALLLWLAQAAGRRGAAERLCWSLQVDISKAQTLLGWTPPFSLQQGLQVTVEKTAELC
ncbi:MULTISPECIES: NAD-dependent epimerase/dehydratase family protein [unclassified Undibacterium]|uniref:NAD-dependent epimerase/dehydratase family protein n=1 Tax=unclassified Undibacterium TaxID=2630295 RepID=UPI002AC8C46C|nr:MULTISPECIES: NAD-dependent epimerase/dehydratase family protein [unclassified Undibacterium]MEB0139892.1 NAD-dependent epimerase/dehydratase family protein [Undibacterium sp. CCC2.1]MEB0171839.1 NAD-dependent epimerase/dehydratase family protein [Undibacterium sp. CCC1.1]MEB0175655.1 NAD-dependent epimerase/dehydratase family protein [Undibacterium sp. CCC3.4]MEB0216237.1 NAD-dependent epimerase/dehydratase family protein [Undibacterium sp. 5I2]WPX44130.1 NAD-dependent epimerase/dehydratas